MTMIGTLIFYVGLFGFFVGLIGLIKGHVDLLKIHSRKDALKIVGVACCPADAADEIKEISLFVSSKKGGEGCVREITEQVLRAKGLWMDDDAFNT